MYKQTFGSQFKNFTASLNVQYAQLWQCLKLVIVLSFFENNASFHEKRKQITNIVVRLVRSKILRKVTNRLLRSWGYYNYATSVKLFQIVYYQTTWKMAKMTTALTNFNTLTAIRSNFILNKKTNVRSLLEIARFCRQTFISILAQSHLNEIVNVILFFFL